MSKFGHNIYLTIIIVLLLIVAVPLINYFIEKNNNETFLTEKGEKAMGIVVERSSLGEFSNYIKCKFVVREKYFSSKIKVDGFEYKNDIEINIGDSVNIFYEKRNPRNNLIDLKSIIDERKD